MRSRKPKTAAERRNEAINKYRCPKCAAKLRWMPSPSVGCSVKLVFCDNPLCDFEMDEKNGTQIV